MPNCTPNYSTMYTPIMPNSNPLYRLMGVLKNYVTSRSTPCENLVKAYSMRTMLRRCPADLRSSVEQRWLQSGLQPLQRGLLVSIGALLHKRNIQAGSGKLVVKLSRRNSTQLQFVSIHRGWRTVFDKYNRTHQVTFRFPFSSPQKCSLWEFKEFRRGVLLDGQDIRARGALGVMWTTTTGRTETIHVGDIDTMLYVQSLEYAGRQLLFIKVNMHNIFPMCAQYTVNMHNVLPMYAQYLTMTHLRRYANTLSVVTSDHSPSLAL